MTATIDVHLDSATIPDPIVELVRVLGECTARWPPAAAARERLVWAAVAHGRNRRSAGSEETAVFEDYDVLREHLWHGIRRHPSGPGVASELILRVDAAISLAIAAALRGYYEDVIARSGEWPSAVERLLWDWRISAPAENDG